MENTYTTTERSTDILNENMPPKRPGMLNVLTILTFIGCGFAYIGAFTQIFMTKDYTSTLSQLEDARDKAGEGFAKNMIDSTIQSMESHKAYYVSMYENRYIIMGSMLIFTTMCLMGAIQMRKLRKGGFIMYTIGELAPVLVLGALVGFGGDGTWKSMIGIILPVVFVALYATQRKHLANP